MNRQHHYNRSAALARAEHIEHAGPYWPMGREMAARELARLLADGTLPRVDLDVAAANNWAYAEVQS